MFNGILVEAALPSGQLLHVAFVALGESQLNRCCACSTAVPSCLAQDDPYDTPYPANYTGPGAEPVPTSASDGWHFPRPLSTAPETYPTAGSAGQGFTAAACGSTDTGYFVSYRMSYTPEGSRDYAVHLSLLTPYPNNITGKDPANQLTLGLPFKPSFCFCLAWLSLNVSEPESACLLHSTLVCQRSFQSLLCASCTVSKLSYPHHRHDHSMISSLLVVAVIMRAALQPAVNCVEAEHARIPLS